MHKSSPSRNPIAKIGTLSGRGIKCEHFETCLPIVDPEKNAGRFIYLCLQHYQKFTGHFTGIEFLSVLLMGSMEVPYVPRVMLIDTLRPGRNSPPGEIGMRDWRVFSIFT